MFNHQKYKVEVNYIQIIDFELILFRKYKKMY